MVRINGVDYKVDGEKLIDFIKQYGFVLTRIVVEYNGKILPRADLGTVLLSDGDVVEIVSFVGGG